MQYVSWSSLSKEAFILSKSVHIWKIEYAAFSGEEEKIQRVLNNNEIARANKFHYPIDRKRYSVTRALLKIILGNVINKDPLDIDFTYNAHGKPLLKNHTTVYFNVSHSAELGLIAVSDLPCLGVDIEKHRTRIDCVKLAKRFFSENEQISFLKLADSQKTEGFFYGWTRKEALIKALGLGLAMPLKNFDVKLEPGSNAELLNIRYKSEHSADWTIKNIVLDNDYAAAYAVKARDFNDSFWSSAGLI